ncbi:HYR domain-containing protein [Marivirga sp. S37H4]|uniref:HYR domain-containing protein n=1 Tax=Marivirga aurantiaca TaxID=2802615 RepID=A0A934WWW2_9BACT|nr:HYR domain-containing protein [Marivirga aurantiaca]MBK6264360.1 HYR domain-containing protein [Marivirga aurantiaca]
MYFFNVTVTDETMPVFSDCPADISISTTSSCEATVDWTEPSVSDNCSTELTATGSHSPGDVFPLGTTEVVYTATDDAGNTSTCTFNVTVTDEAMPVFSGCPSDINVSTTSSCEATVDWIEPTVSDICSTELTATGSHSPGDVFPLGTTEVVYTATDDAGNTSTCTFNVTVTDESAPKIEDCPSDIVYNTTTSCEVKVNWDEPTLANCNNTSELTSNYRPGDVFPVGVTEVVYTATNETGNTSCSFNITVKNNNETIISNCPKDVTIQADQSGEVSVDWENPTLTVGCKSIVLNGSHEPGDIFPIGTTEVDYTFIDERNRSYSCSFNVIVTYENMEFGIQKVLTPNNDGYNDVWELKDIGKFKTIKIVIIDRWGSEVFSIFGNHHARLVWDGTNQNGKMVSAGTYYYFISVSYASSVVEKSGFIELIR